MILRVMRTKSLDQLPEFFDRERLVSSLVQMPLLSRKGPQPS